MNLGALSEGSWRKRCTPMSVFYDETAANARWICLFQAPVAIITPRCCERATLLAEGRPVFQESDDGLRGDLRGSLVPRIRGKKLFVLGI